ncbi:MAG: hypothetical protein CMP16_01955 [Rickettsiales bacterium]|nr:hypothetical protein [Rickettsiales bacterium]
MNIESNFIEFRNAKRIWAIGSVHSNYKSLESIKQHIISNFKKNDKLVFLGNIIGLGNNARDTLNSVLNLRLTLMGKFNLFPDDIVFLRGAQEEMFLKLMQLQIAPNPNDILSWMFDHGVNRTIESYGLSSEEIKTIANQGTISISKWTSKLNLEVSSIPGHKDYFSNLKHAAFTSSKKILFVNRGVDISRPLSAQNDCFWWGYQNFSKLNQPYNSFIRIVRGYQSQIQNNLSNVKNTVVCTLFNQPLENSKVLGGLFGINGEILDLFESS